MAAVLATDSVVAGYRIAGIVGSGGMGIVYRARQRSLDRDVALKIMADGLIDDERFRARFVRESCIAATLEHPHVLPVHEAGQHDGGLFIAMQLVPGGDLGRLIAARSGLDPHVVVAVVAQVAEALDAAHARGLVHRDVKPANVLMARRRNGWHAYLTDFGLSGHEGSRTGLTAIGTPLGTPDYIAPEQIRGGDTDGRTDVYALGCLLVKALTGEVPFRRDGEVAVMWAHMRDQPPRVSTTPGVPRALDDVVQRALAKDPAERPQSAGALASEVTSAVEGRPRVSRRKARRSPLIRIVASVGRTPRWLRRAFAASLAALLGIGAVLDASLAPHRQAHPLRPVAVPAGAPIPVGNKPTALSVGRSGVWVANTGDDTVSLIDPHTDSVNRRPIPVGREPVGIAVDRGSVWVANHASGTVTRIDERSHRVIGKPIAVPQRPYGLVAGGRYVWVATDGPSELCALDAASGRRAKPLIRIGSGLEGGLAADRRSVWVGQFLQGAVRGVDVRTRTLGAPLPVGGQPSDIALSRGAAWVAVRRIGLVRIDPASGRRIRVPVPGGALRLAGADGSVWALGAGGALSRFDGDSGRRLGRSIAVGSDPSDVAAGHGSAWVVDRGRNAVVHVVPTTVGAVR